MKKQRPKKHLGQHFLTDSYYAEGIAEAVPADRGDSVIEIGAGRGDLSIHLSSLFDNLYMIEKDGDIIPDLRSRVDVDEKRVVSGDVFDFDFSVFDSFHAVGNLPYNSAAFIIKRVLWCFPAVRSVTFMLQKEVAVRIEQGPGNRNTGFLSVFCHYFGTPSILFDIPPGAFHPKPKIYSSVIQIHVDQEKGTRLAPEDREFFFGFVSKGFSQRRKKLVNSISDTTEERSIYTGVLSNMGKSESVRAEEMSMEEWIEFYLLSKENKG